MKREFNVSANRNTSCDTVIYINVLDRTEVHGGENAQPLWEAAAKSNCSWLWPHISSFLSLPSLEKLSWRETKGVTEDEHWASTACRRPRKGAEQTAKSGSLPATLGVSLGVSCQTIIWKTLPTPLRHEGESGASVCWIWQTHRWAQAFFGKNWGTLVRNQTKPKNSWIWERGNHPTANKFK